MSRRQLLSLVVAYAGTTAVLGIGGGLPNRKLPRPPGAQEWFLQACIRCNACVDVCPMRVIKPADLTDSYVNVGTPKLTSCCIIFRDLQNVDLEAALAWKKNGHPRDQAETCFECIKACPSGALQPVAVDQVRIGAAVVDRELCKAWRYYSCTFPCIDICPVDAISLTAGPVVDEGKCIGCNLCSVACITVVQPVGIAVQLSPSW